MEGKPEVYRGQDWHVGGEPRFPGNGGEGPVVAGAPAVAVASVLAILADSVETAA